MRWQIAQWFEKLWWKRYLSKKQPQEYLDWKRSYWNQFLTDLNVIPKERILDAGCGPAGINIVLNSSQLWAVDPLLKDYEALDIFNQGKNPRTNFLKSTLESLALDVQFDQVFCINVINHVERIEPSLESLWKHTKSGGELILTTDCHRHRFWQFLFSLMPFDILHPHQYYQSQYAQKLTAAGWRIVETTKLSHDFIFDYYAFQCVKD